MSQVATITRISDQTLGAPLVREPAASVRRIVHRTAGRKRGPITRLMSPSDLGEMLKPFVFLDHAEVPYTGPELAGIHPHSGIATLTTVLQGGLAVRGHHRQARRSSDGRSRVDEGRWRRLARRWSGPRRSAARVPALGCAAAVRRELAAGEPVHLRRRQCRKTDPCA